MCARTQFMTDSFLWAERPIMSKTNKTMKHNASATAYYKRFISAICASMDEDIYVFSNSIILFYFSTIFKSKPKFFMASLYTCFFPFGTYTTPPYGKYASRSRTGGTLE